MSHSNQIKLSLIPLSLVLSLALIFSISAPKVSAASSYDDCMAKVKKIDDVSKLRNKAINPAVDKRLEKINGELRKKAETLPADHQAVIDNGLNADIVYLEAMKSNSSRITDVRVLQANYCQIIYKTQLFQFRARQIAYIKYVDARINRDMTFQKILDHPYNTNVRSSLKSSIDERYNSARSLINSNLELERADASAILAAKTTDYTNNLAKPVFGGNDITANYRKAILQYTEASVLKKAAASFSKDRSLSLVSVELKNKDGQAATNSAREATKAVVVINVDGEKGNFTKELTRANSVSAWKVSKTITPPR